MIQNKIITDTNQNILNNEEDLKIFSLKIEAQEGEYVIADIICKRGKIDSPFILLGINNKPFFIGKILKEAINIDPDQMRMQYIAKTKHFEKDIATDSFFKDLHFQNFFLPFVDPLTHEEKLISPQVENTEPTRDLTPFILENSLHIEQIRTPLTSFSFKISAYWEQKINHMINLWPYIQKSFPGHCVSTFTANALKASFPEIGQYLGVKDYKKNGYSTFYSRLKKQKIQKTLPLILQEKESIALPLQEFKGELIVLASSAFLRKEELCLTLKKQNDGLITIQNQPDIKNIDHTFYIKNEFLQDDWGTFFDKEEAKNMAKQAITLAYHKLLFSNFCDTADFIIPFEKGVHLRIGDTICITHEDKKQLGRISKIKSISTVKKAYTRIILTLIPSDIALTSFEAEIQKAIDHIFSSTEDGDVFSHPQKLTSDDFIQSVKIENTADEQEIQLKKQNFKTSSDIQKFLRTIPTTIHLELQDLRNKDVMIKQYQKKEENNALAK
jgi:hypothetical protein